MYGGWQVQIGMSVPDGAENPACAANGAASCTWQSPKLRQPFSPSLHVGRSMLHRLQLGYKSDAFRGSQTRSDDAHSTPPVGSHVVKFFGTAAVVFSVQKFCGHLSGHVANPHSRNLHAVASVWQLSLTTALFCKAVVQSVHGPVGQFAMSGRHVSCRAVAAQNKQSIETEISAATVTINNPNHSNRNIFQNFASRGPKMPPKELKKKKKTFSRKISGDEQSFWRLAKPIAKAFTKR